MFVSLDMSSLSCSSLSDGVLIRQLVSNYTNSTAQARYQGKQLVSTFAGENCYFGQSTVQAGWLAAFTNPLKAANVSVSMGGQFRSNLLPRSSRIDTD